MGFTASDDGIIGYTHDERDRDGIEITPGRVTMRDASGDVVAHSDMTIDEIHAAFGNPNLGTAAGFWLGMALAAREAGGQ